MEMELIQPGGILLPPSMRMKDVETTGGFSKGEIVPLKGLFLRVVALQQRGDGYFQLTLAPIGATKGTIKKATGKKGVRHEAPRSRYRGRPVVRTRLVKRVSEAGAQA